MLHLEVVYSCVNKCDVTRLRHHSNDMWKYQIIPYLNILHPHMGLPLRLGSRPPTIYIRR